MERLLSRWQLKTIPVLSAIVLFLFLAWCLTFRLVSATHMLAANYEQQNMLHGWHAIVHDPLNAPYFIALRLVRYVNHSLFYARAVGAGFGLLACGLFYYVTRKWLNYQLAVFGTMLFGVNSYFLYSARQVAPLTLQLLVSLGLIALASATHRANRPRVLWLWAIIIPILLYVPGALWLVLAGLFVARGKLREYWLQESILQKLFMFLSSVILLAPLGYFLVSQTLNFHNVIAIEAWTGVTQHGRLAALSGLAKALLLAPVHLFVHTSGGSGIATLPAIGIAVAALALLGAYVHVWRKHDARWRFNIAVLGAAWFAVGLGGMDIITMIPILYLLAIVGLTYLLSEWYKVFPRNPLARGFGLMLIIALVFASCLYNLRAYFVVGPHNTISAQTFICPAKQPRPSACPQGIL